MYLKRLELQGFKSFADKTVLDFRGGVTAVVGPNGSGKSNISDAIRWVLGEMSAKTLRGANMQDVIFSGTQSRKQLNFAEVSLVLDNSDGIFPIEFDEIVVTRRVFRSGESVYQINRANCRLKDIHELFMDTGLGRDGYSMIGQGNVAQILSTKAEDRRSLFEEAAGISKVRHKKEEACRNLERTNENLVRVTDIIAELENQVGPLEKQSEKARKYLVLYEQFKKLDINLSLINLEKNKAKKQEADKLCDSVNEQIADVSREAGDVDTKLKALFAEATQKDEEQAEKNRLLSENNAKAMAEKTQISVTQTKVKNNEALAVRIDGEIAAAQKRIESKKQAIADSEVQRALKQTEIDSVMAGLDAVSGENSELDKNLRTQRENLESKRNEAFELKSSANAEQIKKNGIDSLRSNFLRRREAIEGELSGHREDVQSKTAEIESMKVRIEDIAAKREKRAQSVARQQEILAEAKKRWEEMSASVSAMQVDYNSKVSKKRMLEDMENDYDGYARSVKAVLKAPELKNISIMGTLSSLVEVKSEYVTAVETALGGALQNIVVETEEDAKEAIAYLRHTKAGRATFLPVSSVNGRVLDNRAEIAKCNGFVGIASELVVYDKKYDGIVKNLLGRVAVFDNIDNGIAVSRKFGYKFRTVTLAGDVLNAGGSMSGGSSSKTGGFLSRANEIKQLAADINQIYRDIEMKKNELESINGDITRAQSQLEVYEPSLHEYDMELTKLSSSILHLESSLEESGSTRRQLEDELNEINIQLKDSDNEVAKIISSVRRMENEAEKLGEEIRELEDMVNMLENERNEKTEQLTQANLVLRDLQNEIENAKRTEQELGADIVHEDEQINAKNEEKQNIGKENEQYIQEIARIEEEIAAVDTASAELEEQIKALGEQKNAIIAKQQEIQDSNKEITERIVLLQKELSRAENQQEKLDMERESMINHIWDEYELTVSAAEELREKVGDEKAAADELASIKGKIRALGSVNMDSIEEYKVVKERYELYTTQKADMDAAKENFQKIISKLQEEMERNFTAQFDIIRESFADSFVELFGGGEGKIYLTDPDNALESGIEIQVQLPGKASQNISLYSGGERSFIAIALLFAILKVKPTPFCILDEIDAALDDVNVSRFATYLHNNFHKTQFIVITHRRGTMEAANILYGVTMQEKGISKLLSLQIDDVDTNIADELVM